MQHRSALGATAACLSLTLLVACAGSGPPRAVSPTRLEARLPDPGFCRILPDDHFLRTPRNVRDQFAPQQPCDDIEYLAPPGSAILFRPAGGDRVVIVCYMSPAERSRIYGIDLFDVDTREHIDVLMETGGQPPAGGCKSALELMAR